jgi:hypothetical protein
VTEFIVMTAATRMPGSCKGRYRKVAIVEVERGVQPKMISERARGVVRIVELHDKLHAEGGSGTAYARALAQAQATCAQMNRPN